MKRLEKSSAYFKYQTPSHSSKKKQSNSQTKAPTPRNDTNLQIQYEKMLKSTAKRTGINDVVASLKSPSSYVPTGPFADPLGFFARKAVSSSTASSTRPNVEDNYQMNDVSDDDDEIMSINTTSSNEEDVVKIGI